jgi:hypothetical protein
MNSLSHFSTTRPTGQGERTNESAKKNLQKLDTHSNGSYGTAMQSLAFALLQCRANQSFET